MTRSRLALTLTAGLAALALAACGSSTSSGESSTASGAASASASPSSSADATLQWCTAYAEITAALSKADSSKVGAQTSLNALGPFDQLWAAAANLGFITQEESDANRRAVTAYSQFVKVLADGKKIDSAEAKAARDGLQKVTVTDQELLASSGKKVETLCGPLLPKASAPASGAASGAPSGAASSAASPAPSAS